MAAPVAAGSTWCLLNSGIVQNTMSRGDINQSFYWKDGPNNRSIADSSYTTRQFAFIGEALRAYSPTGLELSRVGTSLVVTWKRRTRKGGDNWSLLEAPLSEEYERYKLIVYNSGTPVRTVETSTPEFVYVLADYMADFGSMPTTFEISVAQSTPYGVGSARREWITIQRVAA
jgi:hypothetical protein